MFARRIFSLGLALLALGFVGPTMAHLDSGYGELPLSFEANRGQTGGPVRYLSRGPNYTLFLTPNEVVLNLRKPVAPAGVVDFKDPRYLQGLGRAADTAEAKSPWPRADDWGQGTSAAIAALVLPKPDLQFAGHTSAGIAPDRDQSQATTLRLTLEGANPHPAVDGQERLPGIVNYLVGMDPRGWRTGIQTYGKIVYSQIYPGIDLVYYGNQRQLEHDFIVAPGADPSRIRLAFEGAESLSVDPEGNLIIKTDIGEVTLYKPAIYQHVNGTRKAIEGHYMLFGERRIGFGIKHWDRNLALIIDPVLSYSTYFGGGFIEGSSGIALDYLGQAYIVGTTYSDDFPLVKPLQGNHGGGRDTFITALTADGHALRYSTFLGGSGDDDGLGIAVDRLGQVYVTGATTSENFPLTNAIKWTFGGERDVFVASLTKDGRALRYSTYLGGSKQDSGGAITIDRVGQVYVTGQTYSSDFPSVNAFQPTYSGGNPDSYPDAFVASITKDGRRLRYSTYLGGNSYESGHGIAIDHLGRAYVTGHVCSSDFPLADALQANLNGFCDAFISAINADGNSLHYSTFLGGSRDESGNGIAVDTLSQVYVTGETNSSDFPTHNAFQPSLGGGYFGGDYDAFVATLTHDGKAFRYSTYLGGNLPVSAGSIDSGHAIAVNTCGEVYVTGTANSSDFPTQSALQPDYGGGGSESFVSGLTEDGSALIYSSFLGGVGSNDTGNGIALTDSGDVYVTGSTDSPDFPKTEGTFSQRVQDPTWGSVFVSKFSGFTCAPIFFRKLQIDRLSIEHHKPRFLLASNFTLGKDSDGIDPLKENMTLNVGDFETTIPAGSFNFIGHRRYYFRGMVGNLFIEATIHSRGANRYELVVTVNGAYLHPKCNLLDIEIEIGNDKGSVTMNLNDYRNESKFEKNEVCKFKVERIGKRITAS